MPNTVVLNAYSIAYPSISLRIRADVSTQLDPFAIVASEIDSTVGHPARIWNFAGLPRTNYVFQLNVIDGSDNPVQNLAYFDVVPGAIEGTLVRAQEQVQVDITPGLVSGATSFTFDGTDGKPDWRGWQIGMSEISGTNFKIREVELHWDSAIGIGTLLLPGDVFATQQYYHVIFDAKSVPGNSEPTVFDFAIRLITEDTLLAIGDFGKKIIVEPDGDYVELILPLIATISQGRKIMIEVGGIGFKCIKVIPQAGEIINFLSGSLYACPNECFSLYKFTRAVDTYEWRLCDDSGNFKKVGQTVYDDNIEGIVYNKFAFDGAIYNTLQMARLYNQVVLNLPGDQVVSFVNWGVGNNKYKYSLEDGSGNFHVPDRRGIFEKGHTAEISAGTFTPSSVGKHLHFLAYNNADHATEGPIDAAHVLQSNKNNGQTNAYIFSGEPNLSNAPNVIPSGLTGTDKTEVESVTIFKYGYC